MFRYGSFINALITFLLIAAAIYFVVVVPMNKLAERRERGQDPDDQGVPRVPERDPAQGAQVRPLRVRAARRERPASDGLTPRRATPARAADKRACLW